LQGTTRALPEIAADLNVDAVVDGSVARVGEHVRVTAHFVHAASDTHMWSETYDRPVYDVLALQSELACAIADQIRITVTPQEKRRLAVTRSVHPAAYDATLRGLHHARALTRESVERAMTCFREALVRDPGYAPAYAGQAYCYITGIADWYVPVSEALPLAEAAAARAIELDPALAEGHTYFALSQMMYRWEWKRAEHAFQHAIETNPGSSEAHRWYGAFLSAMGRFDEAGKELQRAVESDPLSAEAHALLGMNHYFSRSFEAAVTKLRYSAELDRSYFWDGCCSASRCRRRGTHTRPRVRARPLANVPNKGASSRQRFWPTLRRRSVGARVGAAGSAVREAQQWVRLPLLPGRRAVGAWPAGGGPDQPRAGVPTSLLVDAMARRRSAVRQYS
ncbi:MAG: tetratricopeptide repeat protein, partial [Actinobacteria bacterium]|nr:tetratricopeptide repeat protein [Actinomycetota bacterium]